MAKNTRVRIAPSPTGEPHIGTAYTALFNFAFAQKNKGDFVLRIEDTDQTRLVEGSEEKIYEALSWLGLNPDESPQVGGEFAPYKQSERLDHYQKYAEELVEKRAAFYCDCSSDRLQKIREEQQAKKEVPHYDGKCKKDPPKDPAKCVVRLDVPEDGTTSFQDVIRGEISFKNTDIDDQVLLKSDGFPTYHLASVVDDHEMQISHVIRGEEWLSSTPKHVLLYRAFGWDLPVWAHLPLLRNPDKSKLSKRKNPVSVLWYRQQGYLPEALLNFLALMGWSMPDGKEIFSVTEFIEKFDLKRVDPAGPVFDTQKLDWLNGNYIRSLEETKLVSLLVKGGFSKYSEEQIRAKLPLVKERMKKLKDFDVLTKYFFEPVIVEPTLLSTASGLDYRGTISWLESSKEAYSSIPNNNWKSEAIEETLNNKREELDANKTRFFQINRAAVSGSIATPPLGDTLEAIGKDTVIERTNAAIKKLNELSE
jgi:glutamyl-tRNA synthetase